MAAEPGDIRAVEVRGQKVRELAEQMRVYLKNRTPHGSRSFSVHPDTPVGIIRGALDILYGEDTELFLRPSDVLSLIDNSPSIYLREDPE